jgi:hypothetical protein
MNCLPWLIWVYVGLCARSVYALGLPFGLYARPLQSWDVGIFSKSNPSIKSQVGSTQRN